MLSRSPHLNPGFHFRGWRDGEGAVKCTGWALMLVATVTGARPRGGFLSPTSKAAGCSRCDTSSGKRVLNSVRRKTGDRVRGREERVCGFVARRAPLPEPPAPPRFATVGAAPAPPVRFHL
ncbi:hypothetical protein SKAU_G00047760 [Synaphobranchus kaupii]|uniref:Uncharacterized protein n=1 Tax=Synaphobranchus kaupii TaxID=118154 RepID=A0A9Q1G387_SYNKA|nr:hypothetical protein SKAU_G00047760 [Synaphobranchus kaupii]